MHQTSLSQNIQQIAPTPTSLLPTMGTIVVLVAPSFEMVTDEPVYMSLSMPQGPSVVRTVFTMASHALMLLMIWPRPCEVSVPSLSRMMPGCCSERHEGHNGATHKHVTHLG